MYVPAVAVGKVQEYDVVGVGVPEEFTGAAFVHATELPAGSVTVQAMVPAGCGSPADCAATRAVRVSLWPSACVPASEIEIVGVSVETLTLAEFELPLK